MFISAPIPGQETRNAEWLIKNEAAVEIKYPGELKGLIRRFMDRGPEYQKLKERIRQIAKPSAARDLADFIVRGAK